MKKFIVILILGVLGYYLGTTFYSLGFGDARFEHGVKDIYLEKTVSELNVANTVTSIIVSFRGLIPLVKLQYFSLQLLRLAEYYIKNAIILVIVQYCFLQVIL